MAGELLIVRLQPPPKRRGVVFVRKLIPDETAAVIDTLPEPALLVSSRGRIEYWNHECARLFGCRLELVLGRSLAELIPYPYHASHLTELPIALVRQVLTESQQV
ncbi:hypothetical protein DIPPA_27678 [Diplonema papillatum]|nr:hypothetical protein DIPPA_27678 [Diplonema papillatum]